MEILRRSSASIFKRKTIIWILLALLMSQTSITPQEVPSDVQLLLNNVTRSYAELQNKVSLRAEVSRRVARGEQWQESKRTYEATAAGADLLIRVLERGKRRDYSHTRQKG